MDSYHTGKACQEAFILKLNASGISIRSTALLGTNSDENLTGRLETVRRFKLTKLLLNFHPSQFTLSVVQSTHKFPKVNGRISHSSNSVNGRGETSLDGKRTNGHIQKTSPPVDVFERAWISERVHPWFPRRWRGCFLSGEQFRTQFHGTDSFLRRRTQSLRLFLQASPRGASRPVHSLGLEIASEQSDISPRQMSPRRAQGSRHSLRGFLRS